MICKKAKQIVRERTLKLEKEQLIEDKTKEEVLFIINNNICPYCGEDKIEMESFCSVILGRWSKRRCPNCKLQFMAKWYCDHYSDFKILKENSR